MPPTTPRPLIPTIYLLVICLLAVAVLLQWGIPQYTPLF